MRRLPGLFAFAIGLSFATPGLACSFAPDGRAWSERIAEEPVVFVGRVTALGDDPAACVSDATQPVIGCATFAVELPVRGVDTPSIAVRQGQGADCGLVFSVGERWLFAGTFLGGPSLLIGSANDPAVQ